MSFYSVDLLTVNGVVNYPDYRAETATFDANGNNKEILFTPYNGNQAVDITGIRLDDGKGYQVTISTNIRLDVGYVVKFATGSIKTTDTDVTPIVLRGAPYLALVRVRQAMLELLNDNPQYAQQKLPEPTEPFSAIHLLYSRRERYPFAESWDGIYRIYHYNCEAKIVIIRSSDDAQSFLENFFYRLDSFAGDCWQFDNNCSIDRSDDFENSSPLIDNLVYQQMAQVTLSLQFVYQHYEKERWIERAVIEKGNQVTLVIKGE